MDRNSHQAYWGREALAEVRECRGTRRPAEDRIDLSPLWILRLIFIMIDLIMTG
jgi:hypothetical protein